MAAPNDYTIELTAIAEKVYRRLDQEAQDCIVAGDAGNSKVTTFRMVEEALDKLIPHDPFKPERGLTGRLSGVFRIKKGRLRICYIGSSKMKRITVLFISEKPRKAGDINDPYSVFTRLVRSGKLDQAFDALGVRKPSKSAAAVASASVRH